LVKQCLRFQKPKKPKKPFRFPFVYRDEQQSQTPFHIDGEQKPRRRRLRRLLRLLPPQLTSLLVVGENAQKPFWKTERLLNGFFGSRRPIGGVALEFAAWPK
jgi:hypothetical protein